jgi:hypothetical protein
MTNPPDERCWYAGENRRLLGIQFLESRTGSRIARDSTRSRGGPFPPGNKASMH